MAAEGWLVSKAGDLFWTFKKIPPQKLRFAVTYFPAASELDPYPSEKQLEKEELCAEDGWNLILRWDAMQIFCTANMDAVPLETDPVPQVENIQKTMRKKLIPGYLTIIVVAVWSLCLQLYQLRQAPEEYLSDVSRLVFIPFWTILLLIPVLDLVFYYRWKHRAEKAAEHGISLPFQSHRRITWILLALAIMILLLSCAFSIQRLPLFIIIAAGCGIPVILGQLMMRNLKKKGVSAAMNRFVSGGFVLILCYVCGLSVVAASVNNLISVSDHNSKPSGQYESNGVILDIYNDRLPLETEELTDEKAQWSKKAQFQESPLVAYGSYRQDLIYGQKVHGYDLSYDVIDVKIPVLYDYIKNALITEEKDKIQDDDVFVNHYEPAETVLWNADEVYQLHWSDNVLNTYLVCWDNRIVKITFYWQPTLDQIQKAAESLNPDNGSKY